VIALLVRAAAVVGWLHWRPPAERPQPTGREARHVLRPARCSRPPGRSIEHVVSRSDARHKPPRFRQRSAHLLVVDAKANCGKAFR